jgi:ribose transport system substrate-binding protein
MKRLSRIFTLIARDFSVRLSSRTTMKLRILLIAACAALLASIPSCTGGTGSGKPKVAFVSNNAEEFWTIAEAGATKAGQEKEVQVIFKRPSPGTPAKQKEIIEDLLTQGVQAIAISVQDAKNQGSFLDEVAGRVKLITVDNDAPNTKRLCYIGTNNLEAGRACGELVKKALPDGGKLAIFVGDNTPPNSQERRTGLLDVLEGKPESKEVHDYKPGQQYGKYTLVDVFTDGQDSKKAKDQAADVLTKLQGEDNLIMVGLWAYNPPAILSAVKDAKRTGKVKIVGFDEMENTLQGIEDGDIYGTVVQQPYQFGYQAIDMMATLVKNPGDTSILPKDKLKYVSHRVILKDNPKKEDDVKVFRDELHKLLGK